MGAHDVAPFPLAQVMKLRLAPPPHPPFPPCPVKLTLLLQLAAGGSILENVRWVARCFCAGGLQLLDVLRLLSCYKPSGSLLRGLMYRDFLTSFLGPRRPVRPLQE